MSIQSLVTPEQAQATREDAPAPMRLLKPEELVQIVGGPEIRNGGGGSAIADTNVTSIGG